MSVQKLVECIRQKNNPTVAGLDARLEYIPGFIVTQCIERYGETLEAAAAAMQQFNVSLIDALHDIVPAIKPQAAYYELLGPAGAKVLKHTIDYAHEKGMYVIADIKRKDITKEEFLRGKEQLKASSIFAQESTSSQMLLYGKEVMYSGKLYDFEDRIAKVNAVTMDDVNEAIEINFDKSRMAAAVVGKTDKPLEI